MEVDEVVLERRQQVRAEAAARGIEAGQEVALEEMEEEALHRVLRRSGREALAAQVEVDRLPVRRAELLERRLLRLAAVLRARISVQRVVGNIGAGRLRRGPGRGQT